jgi:hypothetical protein
MVAQLEALAALGLQTHLNPLTQIAALAVVVLCRALLVLQLSVAQITLEVQQVGAVPGTSKILL